MYVGSTASVDGRETSYWIYYWGGGGSRPHVCGHGGDNLEHQAPTITQATYYLVPKGTQVLRSKRISSSIWDEYGQYGMNHTHKRINVWKDDFVPEKHATRHV